MGDWTRSAYFGRLWSGFLVAILAKIRSTQLKQFKNQAGWMILGNHHER
jgi:hypothetical protein